MGASKGAGGKVGVRSGEAAVLGALVGELAVSDAFVVCDTGAMEVVGGGALCAQML